jgi:hypothetical protein
MAYQQPPVLNTGLTPNCPRYDISTINLIKPVLNESVIRLVDPDSQKVAKELRRYIYEILSTLGEYSFTPEQTEIMTCLYTGNIKEKDLRNIKKFLEVLQNIKRGLTGGQLSQVDADKFNAEFAKLKDIKPLKTESNDDINDFKKKEIDFINDCKKLYADIDLQLPKKVDNLVLMELGDANELDLIKLEGLLKNLKECRDFYSFFISRTHDLSYQTKQLENLRMRLPERLLFPFTEDFFVNAYGNNVSHIYKGNYIIPLEVPKELVPMLYECFSWQRLRKNPNDIAAFISNFDYIINFYHANGKNDQQIENCFKMNRLLNSFVVEGPDKKGCRLPTFWMKIFLYYLCDNAKSVQLANLDPMWIKIFVAAMLSMSMNDLAALISKLLVAKNQDAIIAVNKLLKLFNDIMGNVPCAKWVEVLQNDSIFLKTLALNFLLVINLMIMNNNKQVSDKVWRANNEKFMENVFKNIKTLCRNINEHLLVPRYCYTNLTRVSFIKRPRTDMPVLNLSATCLRGASLDDIDCGAFKNVDLSGAIGNCLPKNTCVDFFGILFPAEYTPPELELVDASNLFHRLLDINPNASLITPPSLSLPPGVPPSVMQSIPLQVAIAPRSAIPPAFSASSGGLQRVPPPIPKSAPTSLAASNVRPSIPQKPSYKPPTQ